MKKIATFIILFFICFTLISCGGTNYPGNVKAKYWLSEDNKMMFYFPAEAGRGNASGEYITDENKIEDLILEWDAKTGVVEVKTAGYEKIFTANTTTDSNNLVCTFEIISQEEGYDFPNKMLFRWKQTVNFGCINDIHHWNEVSTHKVEGTLQEETEYRCNVCNGHKNEITKNPQITEFVTFRDLIIPYDYFNQYELNEVDYSTIDSTLGCHIVGLNPNIDFEYGRLMNWYKNGEIFKNSTTLKQVRKFEDNIIEISEFVHTGEDASIQFEQVENGIGFSLYQPDDIMYVNTFEKGGTQTFMIDVKPDHILYLNTTAIKYEYRVYPGLEIVKVSGEYDDSKNRTELKNVTFEVTYIIKDNTIIAFLFHEKAINDAGTEYTEITKYCIPYEGEVNSLPKEVVDELMKVQS